MSNSHSDGNFADLYGTQKRFFHIGGPNRPGFKPGNEGGDDKLHAINKDEGNVYVPLLASHISQYQGTTDINQLSTHLDLAGKIVNIIGAVDGNTDPPGGGFYICKGPSGSKWNVDDIIFWYDGSGYKIPKMSGSVDPHAINTHITTAETIDIIENSPNVRQTLMDNSLYAWEDNKWVLKGNIGQGGLVVVKATCSNGQSGGATTTKCEDGSIITNVVFQVTAPFSTGLHVELCTVNGQGVKLQSLINSNVVPPEITKGIANTYVKLQPQIIDTNKGGAFRIIVTGTGSEGAATAWVTFGKALG